MKKLIVACAAIVAATLFSGSAFAIPGAGPAAIQAPSAAVKVNCGCHRPRYYRPACCGYYSLYTYATPCGCGCGCGCGGGCGYWGSGWGWGGGLLGGIFGW